jgi:ribosome-binding protein aMBF1 (putative translation factor)
MNNAKRGRGGGEKDRLAEGKVEAVRARAPRKPRRPTPHPPSTATGEDPRAVVGRLVHRHRLALGISQEEFADRTGLDRTYVSGIERGVRNPTLLVLWRLAETLQVKPHQLIEDDT